MRDIADSPHYLYQRILLINWLTAERIAVIDRYALFLFADFNFGSLPPDWAV